MKCHRPVVSQIALALEQIFALRADQIGSRGYHADKVLERIFQNHKQLGARDRRFIAEGTYDIVRWWRKLRFGVGFEQELATIDEIWPIIAAWMIDSGGEIPAWTEFSSIVIDRVRNRLELGAEIPAVRESVPDWLFDLGVRELGEAQWLKMLKELNCLAPVVLRVNRLKTTPESLKAEFAHEGISCRIAPDAPDGLILAERRNIFTSESFRRGFFEVQDGASQQAAPFLDVQPGMRVIDGCAGAGGKTLHLAALMKNKGKIIAMDIEDRRLEELRKRTTRAGVDIVETRLIDSSKVVKRLEGSADRVLLDVPCTGLGVLRRNPDTKWKMRPEEVTRLRSLQREILHRYSRLVKPGGQLVYATCSVLPSENQDQVQEYLRENQDSWKFIKEKVFLPGVHGYDGFYVALIERLV